MARYTTSLNIRLEPEQHDRLRFLAGQVELHEAEVIRAMLDGYASVNGVHLVRSLRAFREAGRPRRKDVVTVLPTGAIENAT